MNVAPLPTGRRRVPRGIVSSMWDATFGSVEAVQRAYADYWLTAWQRQATPLQLTHEMLTWWGRVNTRKQPQWTHEHTIKKEWPVARLRDFSDPDAEPEQIATLILPPQAGHDSCIVDYGPGQSQVLTAREHGCERIFTMDWKPATEETKHTNIDDYMQVIREAVDLCGGKVNLVGDCQGGWLAVIFAALHPDLINTLGVAGAPIDYHAGEPLIHDWVRLMAPADDLGIYRAIVDVNDGMLPGTFLLGGFKAMQLSGELDRHMQLLINLHDEQFVNRYDKFATWYEWTQPIPGDFYLWIVENLFKGNKLITGDVVVEGRKVDLTQITCPLFLFAGTADHITPPDQVWALADYVGTPDSQVVRQLSRGGHLGLFMGHDALDNHWSVVFAEMALLSDPESDHVMSAEDHDHLDLLTIERQRSAAVRESRQPEDIAKYQAEIMHRSEERHRPRAKIGGQPVDGGDEKPDVVAKAKAKLAEKVEARAAAKDESAGAQPEAKAGDSEEKSERPPAKRKPAPASTVTTPVTRVPSSRAARPSGAPVSRRTRKTTAAKSENGAAKAAAKNAPPRRQRTAPTPRTTTKKTESEG